ncbi:hypothetical protein [Thermodesulfovibrio hydrogeniphilus]
MKTKMQKVRFNCPLLALYSIALILLVVETVFYLSGKSLCTTEGCRVVESFVKGGDLVLLLTGIALFGLLIIFTLRELKGKSTFATFGHSLTLTTALAIEGYLVGFQIFVVKNFCYFCLAVFAILLLATIIRILKRKNEMIFALTSFAGVLFMTYFVSPQINQLLPLSDQVLIYSKNCPHCEEVIQFCEKKAISVEKIEAENVSSILKALDINSVPVLYCNENGEKKFLLGADKIKEYLLFKTILHSVPSKVCSISKNDCQGKSKL